MAGAVGRFGADQAVVAVVAVAADDVTAFAAPFFHQVAGRVVNISRAAEPEVVDRVELAGGVVIVTAAEHAGFVLPLGLMLDQAAHRVVVVLADQLALLAMAFQAEFVETVPAEDLAVQLDVLQIAALIIVVVDALAAWRGGRAAPAQRVVGVGDDAVALLFFADLAEDVVVQVELAVRIAGVMQTPQRVVAVFADQAVPAGLFQQAAQGIALELRQQPVALAQIDIAALGVGVQAAGRVVAVVLVAAVEADFFDQVFVSVVTQLIAFALGVAQADQVAFAVVVIAHDASVGFDALADLRQAVGVAVFGGAAGRVGEMGQKAGGIVFELADAAVGGFGGDEPAQRVVLVLAGGLPALARRRR